MSNVRDHASAAIRSVTVSEVAARLGTEAPDAAPGLLDVRSPAEFATGRIPGSVNLPLADVAPRAPELAAVAATAETPLVLVCRSGARARLAATTLRRAGADVAVLAGGLDAWTAAGQQVEAGPADREPWAMERQVRLVAGSIVLGSLLAGRRFAPARVVAGGIGAGLTFSALTDTCTMARVLAKLPYNRAGADPDAALAALRSR